jgi:hypothetical protein
LFSTFANVPSVDKVQNLASSHNSGKNSCIQSGRTRSGIFGTVLGDAMVLPTHQTKGKGKATYIMRSPHSPVGNALDDITGYVSAGLNYDPIYDFGNYSDIQPKRSATPIDVSNIYAPLPVIGTLKYSNANLLSQLEEKPLGLSNSSSLRICSLGYPNWNIK